MLQEMRKYAKSWVASIFLGALALSFAVWGIADIFKGTTDTNVATVGGTPISLAEYQRDFSNFLKGQRGLNGAQMSTDEAKKLGVPQQTLQTMINRRALDNAVHKLGLTVSDGVIAEQIRAVRQFTGALGTFDHSGFQRIIADRGYTEQGFIELVRNDLSRDQLLNAARSGYALPPGYVIALLSFLNETRAADYVVVPASATGTIPAPTDAQLTAFVKKNAVRFSTPEYREVTYAEISPDDLAEQIQVSDAQLKAEYTLRKDNPQYAYVVAEKRDVQQLGFHDEASAKAARAKLDSGMSFADVARANGAAPINLGSVTQTDLGERGAAVFALPNNGVTQPLKNLAGWVLLHVSSITPGINKTFDDVKADIRKDVAIQLAQLKIQDIATAYTDANSGGMSVADAGKKVGMHVTHIAAVDRNGLAPDGSKSPRGLDPELLAQIFAAEIGEDGDPFATKSGKTYVLKVDGVIPPKVKSLDAVRAEATAAWTNEQRTVLLAKTADALVAQANAQRSLAAAVAAAGTPVLKSGALRRPIGADTGNTPNLPLIVVEKIFSVPAGHAVAGPSANGDSYIVARVTGVAHPPITANTLQFLQGSAQLSHQAADDLPPVMANAARAAQGVQINQANVNRVTGEGS